MQPLHETRSAPDVLLEISRKLSKPLNLPWQKFEDMLKESGTTGAAVQRIRRPPPQSPTPSLNSTEIRANMDFISFRFRPPHFSMAHWRIYLSYRNCRTQ